MTRPGTNVTSDADTQPGSDSLFPTGFSGGGALVRSGSVGTGELADGSVAAADLNLVSVATALAARSEFITTYANRSSLIKSQFRLRPPFVLTSPPTTTAGVANAASAIASSVEVTAFEPGAFAFLGGPVDRGVSIPDGYCYKLGVYPQITSSAPVTAECWLDTADSTGRFEVHWKGNGHGVRVAVMQSDGSWGYVSAADTFTHTSDGSLYRDLVTLGAAGRYKLRLEFGPGSLFIGLQVAPTDTVTATVRSKRYIVVGDSFSEPTISDSGSWSYSDGWPVQLAYLTGLDIWCAGSGGTGYLNPNSGASRVKFRDRLAQDILAYNPDGIIWAGGINDYGNYTASAVGVEALACYQTAQAAKPGIDQVVLSPFYPQRLYTTAISNLLATSDAIAAAAASIGATWLNLLELPNPDYTLGWAGTTLQSSASANATTIILGDLPAYFKKVNAQQYGWYVRVGNGATAENRYVNSFTGSGPYTLTLQTALTNAHTSGDPVTISGGSYMTGTGRQGNTQGNGNADRYTGTDTTHPTRLGELHIARTVANLWAAKLPA